MVEEWEPKWKNELQIADNNLQIVQRSIINFIIDGCHLSIETEANIMIKLSEGNLNLGEDQNIIVVR